MPVAHKLVDAIRHSHCRVEVQTTGIAFDSATMTFCMYSIAAFRFAIFTLIQLCCKCWVMYPGVHTDEFLVCQALVDFCQFSSTQPQGFLSLALWNHYLPFISLQTSLSTSALNSLSMNPSQTQIEANPHSDVGWSKFNPGWQKCGFLVSDCIHACARASDMHSKEMTGRQQRGYSMAFWAQPLCRASLQSFEDFTKVSSSPHVLPMHIRQSFGCLWRIVSAMTSNSGSSSSNAISRSDRHIIKNEQWTAMN